MGSSLPLPGGGRLVDLTDVMIAGAAEGEFVGVHSLEDNVPLFANLPVPAAPGGGDPSGVIAAESWVPGANESIDIASNVFVKFTSPSLSVDVGEVVIPDPGGLDVIVSIGGTWCAPVATPYGVNLGLWDVDAGALLDECELIVIPAGGSSLANQRFRLTSTFLLSNFAGGLVQMRGRCSTGGAQTMRLLLGPTRGAVVMVATLGAPVVIGS